jgi:hypothetical protein
MKRIRHFHVLNPNALLMPDGGSCKKVAKAMKKMWHRNSVHLVPDSYKMLAESLMKELQDAEFTWPADTEDDMPGSAGGTPAAAAAIRKHERQPVDNRKSWVKKDDAIVHRSHAGASRGRGWSHGARGQQGQQGHRGHRGQRGHHVPYRGARGKDGHWRNRGGRHHPY